MYILNVDKKGDVRVQDENVTLVPEFLAVLQEEGLGSDALKWVALITDYDSPYAYLPIEERKKVVTRDIYGKYNIKFANSKVISDAIEKYKSLQFDPLDEQYAAFNKKINEYTVLMDKMPVTPDNAADIQKIMIGIEKVLNTRQKIIDAIEKRGKRQKIQGGRELSFLESRFEASNNK
tara:strand:+ start:4348 stop:4881 length:534 start_codon:yes stop_codon:yes gene_type:complete